MKLLNILSLVFLLGCVTPSNKKWLTAAQHMVEIVNDPLVSTPDPEKVKIFVNWAKKQGYKVSVSHVDQVAGTNPKMYFIVVSK